MIILVRSVDVDWDFMARTVFDCCRENDVTGLETTFSVDHDAYGEHQVHDLKANGRDILVTELSKKEYVK